MAWVVVVLGAVAVVLAADWVWGVALARGWVRPRDRRQRGAAAVTLEELQALLGPGKRHELEQRRVELVLRDDEHATGPPGTVVDLERGTAVVKLPRRHG
ncbi:hypothetical protein TH66_23065 [Carbonactinospora thermoautotrophica]|uniref:Uncharacterized protein n=2 Tax=Carbonactinospora thermoautotrophica TaxID=1469144 RepID=A0A132MJV2_9ACTN|nr:DUF6191 domain-containing protein [Carbonactinospora thermoautotrophica]KWW98134.1 hypothetical protein TH66_23065 [Carbonactinospora thermoautotrophica]KWX02850.1 hypothetical protein LI90_3897 [Carbonactinospora thermoautotrophica]